MLRLDSSVNSVRAPPLPLTDSVTAVVGSWVAFCVCLIPSPWQPPLLGQVGTACRERGPSSSGYS